jgi:hypothetical protein
MCYYYVIGGQDENIGKKIADMCLEDVAEFRYLGTTLTDQISCTKRRRME